MKRVLIIDQELINMNKGTSENRVSSSLITLYLDIQHTQKYLYTHKPLINSFILLFPVYLHGTISEKNLKRSIPISLRVKNSKCDKVPKKK
jgi:hypothetical protein